MMDSIDGVADARRLWICMQPNSGNVVGEVCLDGRRVVEMEGTCCNDQM